MSIEQAFGNARSIAKAGAVGRMLEAAEVHKEDLAVLGTLCVALKAIAVNVRPSLVPLSN